MFIPLITQGNTQIAGVFRYWENKPYFDALEAVDDGSKSWGTWSRAHSVEFIPSTQYWDKINRGMKLPNVEE